VLATLLQYVPVSDDPPVFLAGDGVPVLAPVLQGLYCTCWFQPLQQATPVIAAELCRGAAWPRMHVLRTTICHVHAPGTRKGDPAAHEFYVSAAACHAAPLQPASQDYISSLLALSPAALAHVAADPSGSRVVEALLLGPAPAAAKQQLLQRLQGHWAAVAMSAPGSFVVEKAFDWAVSGDTSWGVTAAAWL
jgi:hypothetical protein